MVGTSRTPWHGSEIADPRIAESAGRSTESRVVNTVRKSSSLAFVPRGDHLRRVREAVRDQWVSADRVDRSRITSWKTREAWEKPRSLPVDVIPMQADEPFGLAVGKDPEAMKIKVPVRIFGGYRSLTGIWRHQRDVRPTLRRHCRIRSRKIRKTSYSQGLAEPNATRIRSPCRCFRRSHIAVSE